MKVWVVFDNKLANFRIGDPLAQVAAEEGERE